MSSPGRILVIRLSSIGDIILTTPVLRRLATRFPGARIDYCTKPTFLSLLQHSGLRGRLYSTEQLPEGPYDLVLDLQNNIRSRRITRSLKVSRIIRYHKQNWKKLLLVQLKLNLFRKDESVVDRYQAGLAGYGIGDDGKGCELTPSSDDRERALAVLGEAGTKTLAVCFGAKHMTKRYPPRDFAAIIEQLHSRLSIRVLLLGGSEDSPFAREIMDGLSPEAASSTMDLSGSCSLMQTAALLERCNAVLTNDTGLMHMASAFHHKLFVIFGSSVREFGFLPYQVESQLFEVEGLRCRPCSHIGRQSCPKGHFRCMRDIPQTAIVAALLDELSP
ncbi:MULTISPECIES: glycosyltransferase family 9 protein [Prosthecochloris]|uniref:Glycosyltransferase family 9 protein n=1 Tax=Prosthecochloris vibrioformis TaxID=1098 RepID=A0A5C4RZD5_PROVB|nr:MULTISPECIES: glycosyltransferase family 9 protein [Prosthecochloris]ANT63929.1 ADP-heptose--LPS heptosyltransferase 2 [Prosthecochloris sp. CIB 2401]TNJ36490.1 glycosyltransferase family 9 protein [Prosthecochloris vibrioformis]